MRKAFSTFGLLAAVLLCLLLAGSRNTCRAQTAASSNPPGSAGAPRSRGDLVRHYKAEAKRFGAGLRWARRRRDAARSQLRPAPAGSPLDRRAPVLFVHEDGSSATIDETLDRLWYERVAEHFEALVKKYEAAAEDPAQPLEPDPPMPVRYEGLVSAHRAARWPLPARPVERPRVFERRRPPGVFDDTLDPRFRKRTAPDQASAPPGASPAMI